MDSLPVKDAAKLTKLIQKIEQYGLLIAERQKWTKKLDSNLYEIRSKLGANIQRAIYFQKIGNQFVITQGFIKKDNKTPLTEIHEATKRRNMYFHKRRDDYE